MGIQGMKKHLRKFHPNEIDNYLEKLPSKVQRLNCEHCEFSCHLRKDMRDHIRRKHTIKKKFPCDLCERLFCGPKAVEKHKRGKYFGELVIS